jgi:hypothetical protein
VIGYHSVLNYLHRERSRLIAEKEIAVVLTHLLSRTAPRLPGTALGSQFHRHHHRLNPNIVALGTNRIITTEITMLSREVLPARKAVIIPWSALISSQRSMVVVLRKRTLLYLCSRGVTALSQEREAMRTLITVTKSHGNRMTIQSENVDHKSMLLTGKRLSVAWLSVLHIR